MFSLKKICWISNNTHEHDPNILAPIPRRRGKSSSKIWSMGNYINVPNQCFSLLCAVVTTTFVKRSFFTEQIGYQNVSVLDVTAAKGDGCDEW